MSEPETTPGFEITYSAGFADWLRQSGGSIAFSTYQAGKLFLLGQDETGAPAGSELAFARCMGIGLSSDARRLYLATQHQIFRFDDFLRKGARAEDGSDALYVPRLSWVTGDLDAHDIGPGPEGRPIFVNTAFNCLAMVSAGYSFRPIWRPDFITGLVAEDRCHLNGMAMEDGHVRYVTLVARSDVRGGWRQSRAAGGLVIEPATGRIVCSGLSMPHSPRLYRGRLWLLNSGAGHFGWVDRQSGVFTPICFCPGYARGLGFAGNHAIIGLSLPRERTFQGLPLDDALAAHGMAPHCGLIVVDLETGRIVAGLQITGSVRELYDVQFLPGIRRPSAAGFRTDRIRGLISIDDRDFRSRG